MGGVVKEGSMKLLVKVTKQDIEFGREAAEYKCGCPIWLALNRTLELGLTEVSEMTLVVNQYYEARLGKFIVLRLPKDAVAFQKLMVAGATPKPFQFNAEVRVRAK